MVRRIGIISVIFALGATVVVAEQKPLSEQDLSWNPDGDGVYRETGPAGGGEGLQYKVEMRDLDREYQAGGLTRTEYIQRKREIETLEE